MPTTKADEVQEPPLPEACLWCRIPKDDARAERPCFFTASHEHEFVPVRTF